MITSIVVNLCFGWYTNVVYLQNDFILVLGLLLYALLVLIEEVQVMGWFMLLL